MQVPSPAIPTNFHAASAAAAAAAAFASPPPAPTPPAPPLRSHVKEDAAGVAWLGVAQTTAGGTTVEGQAGGEAVAGDSSRYSATLGRVSAGTVEYRARAESCQTRMTFFPPETSFGRYDDILQTGLIEREVVSQVYRQFSALPSMTDEWLRHCSLSFFRECFNLSSGVRGNQAKLYVRPSRVFSVSLPLLRVPYDGAPIELFTTGSLPTCRPFPPAPPPLSWSLVFLCGVDKREVLGRSGVRIYRAVCPRPYHASQVAPRQP